MQSRIIGTQWQKTFIRIVRHPTFEVLAAIVVVLLAFWLVVQTEVDLRQSPRAGAVKAGPR